MTFFKQQPLPELKIPMEYSKIPFTWKHKIRAMYEREQQGLCMHCSCPLNGPPPSIVTDKPIDWGLFPKNFMDSPIHLHHDHGSDMTLGVVHNYCNAVMWQYHGE